MGNESMFLVENAVVARRLTDFLDVDRLVQPPAAEGPSLPMTPDGTLQAGQLYPDESSITRHWYLPAYALNVTDGRYTSALKWRGPDDDPTGPLAFLTVQLAAPAPGVPGPELAEIPHTAVVRLAYELPVQGSDASSVGATFSFEIGALGVEASGVRSCRVPVVTKPDFDRLYAVMTDPAMKGRIEIRCTATMGQRIQRPVWHAVEVTAEVERPWLNVLRDRTGLTMSATRFVVDRARLPTEVFEPAVPAVDEAVAPLRDVLRVRRLAADAVRFEQPLRIDEPVLVDQPVRWRPEWLWPAVVRPEAATEIVQVSVETVETVAFVFPVETNAYMFDIPGDLRPTSNEILIPNTVIVDGDVTTFYQDSAYPERFYFAPQELRLARADTPPYLPRLVFAFDLKEPEAGAPADAAAVPDYAVRIAFEASPWISPLTLAEIRQQVAAGPKPVQFMPLSPVTTELSLLLPDEAGGPAVATLQPGASVSFDHGVTDELVLTPNQFKALVVALTTTGIDGHVTATLVGSTTKDVPVSLSFARTSGHVFSRAVQPTAAPGTYDVVLTNDIESTVTVHSAHVGLLAPGVVAIPNPVDPVPVPPGGQLTLTYRVQPATATVLDIEPDVDVTIAVDAATVLPHLMLAEGYRSDTFTVPISTDAAYFAAPGPDGKMLAGLLVEFDSGARVGLDAASLQASITLHMPWLPYLLDEPEAKQYRYRVTNVWAGDPDPVADVPGPWSDGGGEAELAIVPSSPAPANPSGPV